MKIKQHFKSGKQAKLFTVVLILILMSVGGCENPHREACFNLLEIHEAYRDSVNTILMKPYEIQFPLKVNTISNDGYAIMVDVKGNEFSANCNPEDYQINQIIK